MKKKLISIFLTVVLFVTAFAIPASAASNVGAHTSCNLNLRKSGSTSATVLMTMPKGTEVIVLSSTTYWSKVMYNNTIGYASKKYLTSDSYVSGKFGTGTINATDVYMRKGAGTGYSIIDSYQKGTKMTVTGAKNNWYKVSYSGKTGYVYSKYLTISVTPAKTSYKGEIIGTDVCMRKGAGTSYDVRGMYSKGTTMKVYGSKSGWYNVSYDGKTGYVSGTYMHITPKTEYSSSKNGKITAKSAYLRMGPSTAFSVKKTLSKGTVAKVTGLNGSWYEVTVDGKYGYVYKDNITVTTIVTPKEKMSGSGTVTGDSVRIRRGPSTNYAIVGYCNTGDKVKITGKSGNWYAVTCNDVSGYISASYVKKISTGSSYSSTTAEKIISMAKDYLGVPYVYGGASPSGFDCSGLVYYVFGENGYKLQRGATSQYNTNGTSVKKENLKPADLVFFSDSVDPIGHVGIYIGDGQFIHASSGKGEVTINNLSDNYYYEHYTGAKRVI